MKYLTMAAICLGLALPFAGSTTAHAQREQQGGYPLAGSSCYEYLGCEPLLDCSQEAEVEIQGFFLSDSRSTSIVAVADSDDCQLSHEGSPGVTVDGREIHGWQTCRDPATARDHLLIAKGVLSNGAPVRLETWHVAAGGGLERVGEEGLRHPAEFWGGEFPEEMVSADGVCRPRVNRMWADILDAARAALFSDVGGTIPAETVRTQLLTLGSLEDDAYLYRAVNVGNGRRWSVVMVRLTPECRHEAVVLAWDGRTGDWRSILYVPGGTPGYRNCALTNGALPSFYLPHVMFVEGDRLTMAFEAELFKDREDFGLAVDLRTGRATRLGGDVTGDGPVRISGSELLELFPEETDLSGTIRDCGDCPELMVVPAGGFSMGSADGEDDEFPVRSVEIEEFAIGRYEVTREEFDAFVTSTGYRTEGGCWAVDAAGEWGRNAGVSWREPGFMHTAGHPAVCVSWTDAQAYVEWLRVQTGEDYRLPSEAEWEYAARGGTTTERYWGDAAGEQCLYANGADETMTEELPGRSVGCRDGTVYTSSVGSFAPNGFGLFDMLGNVWEWVADCWHGSYAGAPSSGEAWTYDGNCRSRMLRGGSWSGNARYLRSADRNVYRTSIRMINGGFRVARSLD